MILDDFYKMVKLFLKELISVFPDDNSLKIFSTSLSLAMKEQNNKICIQFYELLLPFEDLIINKNDQFFEVNKNYKNEHQKELFEKLKGYYFILDEHNQSIIWAYLQNIYNISKEINIFTLN